MWWQQLCWSVQTWIVWDKGLSSNRLDEDWSLWFPKWSWRCWENKAKVVLSPLSHTDRRVSMWTYMPDLIFLSCTMVEAQRGSVLHDDPCSLHPLHEAKHKVEFRSSLVLYSPNCSLFLSLLHLKTWKKINNSKWQWEKARHLQHIVIVLPSWRNLRQRGVGWVPNLESRHQLYRVARCFLPFYIHGGK